MPKKKKPGKPSGKLLWDKLNDKEKEILTNYFIDKHDKKLIENIENRWADMEKYLIQSMRDNRISEERVNKILNELNDKVDRVNGMDIIDDSPVDKYIVLSKDEFQDLIEYAAMNCENCQGIEGCKLYKIQHNQKVPVVDGSFKCKFSFIVNRRKVV